MAERHKCLACPLTFETVRESVVHMKGIHLNQRPFLCMACGERFTHYHELAMHLTAHSKKDSAVEDRPKDDGNGDKGNESTAQDVPQPPRRPRRSAVAYVPTSRTCSPVEGGLPQLELVPVADGRGHARGRCRAGARSLVLDKPPIKEGSSPQKEDKPATLPAPQGGPAPTSSSGRGRGRGRGRRSHPNFSTARPPPEPEDIQDPVKEATPPAQPRDLSQGTGSPPPPTLYPVDASPSPRVLEAAQLAAPPPQLLGPQGPALTSPPAPSRGGRGRGRKVSYRVAYRGAPRRVSHPELNRNRADVRNPVEESHPADPGEGAGTSSPAARGQEDTPQPAEAPPTPMEDLVLMSPSQLGRGGRGKRRGRGRRQYTRTIYCKASRKPSLLEKLRESVEESTPPSRPQPQDPAESMTSPLLPSVSPADASPSPPTLRRVDESPSPPSTLRLAEQRAENHTAQPLRGIALLFPPGRGRGGRGKRRGRGGLLPARTMFCRASRSFNQLDSVQDPVERSTASPPRVRSPSPPTLYPVDESPPAPTLDLVGESAPSSVQDAEVQALNKKRGLLPSGSGRRGRGRGRGQGRREAFGHLGVVESRSVPLQLGGSVTLSGRAMPAASPPHRASSAPTSLAPSMISTSPARSKERPRRSPTAAASTGCNGSLEAAAPGDAGDALPPKAASCEVTASATASKRPRLSTSDEPGSKRQKKSGSSSAGAAPPEATTSGPASEPKKPVPIHELLGMLTGDSARPRDLFLSPEKKGRSTKGRSKRY